MLRLKNIAEKALFSIRFSAGTERTFIFLREKYPDADPCRLYEKHAHPAMGGRVGLSEIRSEFCTDVVVIVSFLFQPKKHEIATPCA